MRYEQIHLKDKFPALGKDGCDPLLSVYLQDNLTEMGRDDNRRPCMIVCPGGAYQYCSQRESEPIVLEFLPAGYQVFLLNYSVAPHTYPTQLREVAAVLELIYEHAADWHCDTNKVAIIGFSAGGHLAAHYSTSYDCEAVRAMFPESKPVQASVLSYPVISAEPAHRHEGSFQNLVGYAPETQADIDAFSCDKLVSEKTPPAFLWHTADDATVPVANSLLYAGALSRYKIPMELHIYRHGYHGLATANEQTVEQMDAEAARVGGWIQLAKQWLEMTL